MTGCHTPGGERRGAGGAVTPKTPQKTKTPPLRQKRVQFVCAKKKTPGEDPENVGQGAKRPAENVIRRPGFSDCVYTLSILCL